MRLMVALFIGFGFVGLWCGCETPSYCDQYPYDSQCQPQSQTKFQPQPYKPPPSGDPGKSSCDQSVSSTPVELSIPYQPQECTNLCWAGSIAMIARYFGRPVQECQLASEKIRLSTGYTYNCCNASVCYDPNCNVPAHVQEVATLFSTSLGIYGTMLSRPLSEVELQIELSNQRPVMVFYQGNQSGHYAVIVGFTPGSPAYYHVNDPWPYFGSLQIPYQSIRLGPNGENWFMTYTRLSLNSDPCAGKLSQYPTSGRIFCLGVSL